MPKDVSQQLVKLRFRLDRDEDGWPPAESEGLWAKAQGGDTYRIENTPWFVRNLAAGDIVRANAGSDGVLWATEKATWSGHCTIRVIPRADGPLQGDLQAVLDAFASFGVTGEGALQYGMVALDVPKASDGRSVKALLVAGESDGRWNFEEGCISEAWLSY